MGELRLLGEQLSAIHCICQPSCELSSRSTAESQEQCATHSGRGRHSKEQASHLSGLPHFPCLLAVSTASFQVLHKEMLMPNGPPFPSGLLSTEFGRLVNTGYRRKGAGQLLLVGEETQDSGATSPGCHADRSDRNQRTVL